ncbi:superoxide dismutase family protein [Luteimonas sp. MC1825]|uniref:superoxide dismutase family protein n=1 Tax=Luteimonas sp. MC1825 TaxID=2761107 RepID=UPI0016152BAE|nr:superoxide dismutase family protein [Luteimonas sp. MC1825]MBB6598120.1 superoxide dismutase family protein [Luteimonas sp. MC1825]QOC88354.1 superoxide dismutase family protein [Luteimonas sp. MC1825]
MRTTSLTLLAAALALALSACGDRAAVDDAATPTTADVPRESTPDVSPPPYVPADDAPASAVAALAATAGNTTAGELRFAAVDGGVHITGQVTGLEPGTEHGFHVHETGDCSAPDGSSAGGHFNPAGTAHGRVGGAAHHAGDTGNITADGAGVAQVDTRLEGVTLGDGAATDVIGKGVIVHADPDDYTTQPTGNAGARLACGVIGPGA